MSRICIKESHKKGDKSKELGETNGGVKEFSLDEIIETKATIQFN